MAHIEAPFAEYMPPGDATKVIAKGHVILGEPAPVDGHIVLGDQPGFGIELDRSLLRPLPEPSA
jgi:L-alanine-DL-glutamate epimerase-like enolase superfamily enzyme